MYINIESKYSQQFSEGSLLQYPVLTSIRQNDVSSLLGIEIQVLFFFIFFATAAILRPEQFLFGTKRDRERER